VSRQTHILSNRELFICLGFTQYDFKFTVVDQLEITSRQSFMGKVLNRDTSD